VPAKKSASTPSLPVIQNLKAIWLRGPLKVVPGGLAGETPLGRLGRVTDIIAPLAVFLTSHDSAWITGEVIRAAGGLVVAT